MDGSQPGALAPLRPLSLRAGRPHGVKKHLRAAAAAAGNAGNRSCQLEAAAVVEALQRKQQKRKKSVVPNKFHKYLLGFFISFRSVTSVTVTEKLTYSAPR